MYIGNNKGHTASISNAICFFEFSLVTHMLISDYTNTSNKLAIILLCYKKRSIELKINEKRKIKYKIQKFSVNTVIFDKVNRQVTQNQISFFFSQFIKSKLFHELLRVENIELFSKTHQ